MRGESHTKPRDQYKTNQTHPSQARLCARAGCLLLESLKRRHTAAWLARPEALALLHRICGAILPLPNTHRRLLLEEQLSAPSITVRGLLQ